MKNKLKKIIVILCIILLFNGYDCSYAVTVEEAGQALASYAYNFYKKGESGSGAALTKYVCEADICNMDTVGTSARSLSYRGTSQNGVYGMDCVGWISFAVHNCLKLGSDTAFTFFVTPQNGGSNGFVSVSDGKLQPGDMLTNSNPHVYMYVGKIDGEDTIVHCVGYGGPGGPKNVTNSGWGVTCEYLSQYEGKNTARKGHYRISESTANGIDKSQIDTAGELLKGSSKKSASGSQYAINMSDFYYNGIPNGKYSVTKGILERIIEALAEIFEFLITLIFNILRMVFVGWTAIFENLVTSTVKSVAGEDNIEIISSTDTGIDSGDNVTVEKIVFNQISIFDVNFFNYNEELQPEPKQN